MWIQAMVCNLGYKGRELAAILKPLVSRRNDAAELKSAKRDYLLRVARPFFKGFFGKRKGFFRVSNYNGKIFFENIKLRNVYTLFIYLI